MYKILEVPKVGNSDIFLKLNLLIANGDFVTNTSIACEFESSKTTFEFEVDDEGYFYCFYDNNDSLRVGETFGVLTKTQLTSDDFLFVKNKYTFKSNDLTFDDVISDDKVITNGAKKLIRLHNLNIDDFDNNLINERIVNEFIDRKNLLNSFINFNFDDNDVLIFGIGGHAGMCIDIINSNGNLNIIGYLDEHESVNNKYGLKYFGKLSDLDKLIEYGLKNVVIGTAFFENIMKRDKIFKEIISKLNVPTIIHASAIIEKSATIGKGCQIMAGSIIGSNVFIGENCIINSGSIISHDTIVGRTCHIAPGACVAGGVSLGDRVLVGMCSTIFLGLKIDSDVVINNNESIICDR